MTFKVLGGIGIIMLVCLGCFFLRICGSFALKHIRKFFSEPDEEEGLTDEEKYKRYLEKKHRELSKERIAIQNIKGKSGEYESAVKIIGFIEPIGRWTRLVMSEKRQKFMGMKQGSMQNGFWQMLVSMKGMYQGKHKGRSR